MKLDLDASAAPAVPATRTYTLKGKHLRVAWLVLFGAFFVCIALTVSVPLLGVQFVRYAGEAQPGALQAVSATAQGVTPVRVTLPNTSQPLAVIEATQITEGSRIETNRTDTSSAFLVFFDSSNATIAPASQLVIQEMRRPRFSISEQPNVITIEQLRGVVKYGIVPQWQYVGNPDGRPMQFTVHTPQLDVWLGQDGAYRVEVTEHLTQVSVTQGSAVARAKDNSREVRVDVGQRIIAAEGKALADPLPAAQNLIVNGDFAESFDCAPNTPSAWKCYTDQGGDGGNINGSIGIVNLGERRSIQIKREGSNQNSAITGIRQYIDRDVSGFRSLKLSADVRLHYQNLSGGGYLSSEYPLIIRLRYRDVNGNETEWWHGFYYQNDTNNPTQDGENFPPDLWLPFETSNLLELLEIKPFRLLYIEIYASGWDYESYVSNVTLNVE